MAFDPQDLLNACARIVAESPWVDVDEAALEIVAAEAGRPEVPAWSGASMFSGPEEQVVAWLLAYNAVNYCYWPDTGPRWYVSIKGHPVGQDDEALAVMAAFAQAMRRGTPLWDADYLQAMDVPTLAALLKPAPDAGVLPMLSDRVEGLKELGRAYALVGGPLGMVASTALGTVDRLATLCPAWDDARNWRGQRVRFLKRAQLCTAMIYGRLRGEGVAAFPDVDRLTAFADYRLPQILRADGVLKLSARLDEWIALGNPVPEGSEEEISLRAAVVHAAELLRARLGVPPLAVDYYLWRTAVDREAALPPFHRTRTTDY